VRNKIVVALIGKAGSVGVDIFERLLIIPIFIAALGADVYADWALLYAFAMLFGVLDLGVVQYFSNLILQSSRHGSAVSLEHVAARAKAVYSLVLAFNLIVIFVISWLGVYQLINITALSESLANFLFVLLAIAVVLNIPRGLLLDKYRLAGDYEKVVISVTALKASRLVCLLVSVYIYNSVLLAALSYSVVTFFLGILGIVAVQRFYRYPRLIQQGALFSGPLFSIEDARKSFSYFVRQCGRLGGQQMPLIVLGAVGIGSLGLVQFIAVRALTGVVRQLVTQLSDAVGLDVSDKWYSGNSSNVAGAIAFSVILLACFSGGVFIILGLYISEILPVWLSSDIKVDYVLFLLLAASVVISVPSLPCLSVLHFTNHAEELAKIFVIKLLVLFLSLPVLSYLFLSRGAGFSVLLSEGIFGSVLIVRATARVASINVAKLFFSAGVSFCLGVLCIVLVNTFVRHLPSGAGEGHIERFVWLGAKLSTLMFALCLLIYAMYKKRQLIDMTVAGRI